MPARHPPTPALISAHAAAKRLGTSPYSLYAYAREGVIPRGVAVYLGRRVKFDAEQLEAWISAGGARFAGGWRRQGGRP
jgi:hypothetical protein